MSERWPLHPPPYPHEALSSWLERQASCYGYRNTDILLSDLGFPALSPEQLDTDPPVSFLERLAERSGLSVERLGAMTLQGWVPQLIDSLKPDMESYSAYVREYELLYPIELRRYQMVRNWIPWMSTHRFSGRTACRLCLKESSDPYRRLSWRMGWMNSCPIHGVLLEELFISVGQTLSEEIEEPVPAPSEILTIDHLTWQALEEGIVSLPHSPVPGGRWLRMLRALLDELILPAAPLKQYRPTVLKIWGALGLGIRQGMRSASIPFEGLDSERQFLLMRLAGVAVEFLMKGALKRAGKEASLFVAMPRSREDLPAPEDRLPSKPPKAATQEEWSAYEQAWRKVNVAMEELEEAMHRDPQTAMQVRRILLGAHPTPEKIEQIDHLFAKQGYLLLEDVT